jgi:hypothetical protein
MRRPTLPPARSRRDTLAHGDLEGAEHRVADPVRAPVRATSWRLRADHRQVTLVRAEHVVHDLLEITATSTRTFGQLHASSRLLRTVERAPARPEQRREPPQIGIAEGFGVCRRWDVGRAEIGRGRAWQPLDDPESGRILRYLEAEPRPLQGPRVPGRVREERPEGGVLVASAPRPRWPVDRPGEHALVAYLEVDRLLARPASSRHPIRCLGFVGSIPIRPGAQRLELVPVMRASRLGAAGRSVSVDRLVAGDRDGTYDLRPHAGGATH